MFELLRPRLPRLLLAVTFGVLALGSALALTAVSAWLITRAWQMPPVLHLTVATVTVRALAISRGVFGYCERLASHDTALRAAADVRERLYLRLATGPAGAVLRRHTGQLVNDVGATVDELSDVLVRAVVPIAVAAVLGVAGVAVIAVISPAAAAVLAVCLLLAGVVAPYLGARAAVSAEKVAAQRHSRRDTAAMTALDYAPELRVNNRLDDVLADADRQQHAWGAAIDRAAAPAAVASAVPTAAMGVSVLGAVLAGVTLAPSVAPTTLAILMLLPLSAFEASAALPAAAVQLARSRIAARRIRALTEADPDEGRRPDLPAVPLAPGARVAVLGPSGSGKTTLLMTLAGLLPTEQPDSQAAFFPEDAHIFATTVRDNLLVARGDADDAELTAALRRVGLGDWLESLPDGLSTVLVGGAAAVSAGQRRRLLLARALISPAPVVLLDEPTEHLDAADSDRFLTELLTPGGLFPPERTVVVATHHLPAGLECQRIELSGSRVTSAV